MSRTVKKNATALRSEAKKKRSGRPASARDQNHSAAIANAISTLTRTITAERKADRKQRQRSEFGRILREWVTIILLFVTGAFVFGQLREMQKVYWPIVRQAEATRESYVAVQRAFVSDVRLDFVRDDSVSGKLAGWFPKVTVTNSGGTPTRGLRYVVVYARWLLGPPKDPEPWLDALPDTFRVVKGSMTIGPQGTAEILTPVVSLITPIPVSDSAVVSVEPRGMFAGAIRYMDQFSKTERRITKFCYLLNASSDKRIFSQPCPNWNCSDKDCERDAQAYKENLHAPQQWPPRGWKTVPSG